jgi:hypothetical protein
MKVGLQQVSEVVTKAIEQARERPDEDATELHNEIVGQLSAVDEAEGPDERVKKAAHDRLHAAATGIDELGDVPERPLVNAVVGVGLAILANGEDAETFYAAFLQGGSHGA